MTTASLSKDFAEKGSLKRLDIDFSGELPPTINAHTTLEMYKLQFRCIRHEIYSDMISSGKNMEDYPEEEFQEVYARAAKKFD